MNTEVDTGTEEEVKSGHPRQDMVDSINEWREKQVAEEILESGGTVQPMHEEEIEPVEEEKEVLTEEDPLAPFIQMDDDGQPMFKMTVDGEEVLMPLDQVRTSHQLEAASRKRMEENADWAKNLAEREAGILAQEEALEKRLTATPEPISELDSDDQDFEAEAQEIFDTLVDDDAEVASKKLASVLKRINERTPSQAPVDEEELVKKAAAAVTEKRTAEQKAQDEADREADFAKGLKQFRETYPDIAKDPKLFGAANNLTNVIAEEEGHEDWMPSQIILEAGKRTQEWVDEMRRPDLDPDLNDRQDKKDKLVVMPPARTGSPEPAEEEEAETPQEALAAIRASRGQPS